MVSLPHQPLLPSSWVEEEVLVNRTNLKPEWLESNLMDIIRGQAILDVKDERGYLSHHGLYNVKIY